MNNQVSQLLLIQILLLYSAITLISLYDQISSWSLVSLWLFSMSLPVRLWLYYTTKFNRRIKSFTAETLCLLNYFLTFCSAWISNISPQDCVKFILQMNPSWAFVRYLVALFSNLVSCLPRKHFKGRVNDRIFFYLYVVIKAEIINKVPHVGE